MPFVSKATPDRLNRIILSLRKGVPFTTACQRAGVHQQTGWRWRRDDVRFDERCQMAESRCERLLVAELLYGGQIVDDESDNAFGELDTLTRALGADGGTPAVKTKHAFPDAVRSQNLRWFLERRWPAKYGTGPIRERAYEEERKDSEGASDTGALTADIQQALLEFAKARTDEATWTAFQTWMREREQGSNEVEHQDETGDANA